jgi:hypothetical protein
MTPSTSRPTETAIVAAMKMNHARYASGDGSRSCYYIPIQEVARPMTITTTRPKRRSTTKARRSPPRSFSCPPDLWARVLAYARAHEIPASAALRVLLSTGLRSQQLATALAWQIEQGWRVVEAMEGGDRREAPRSALTASYEAARRRLLRETRGRRPS